MQLNCRVVAAVELLGAVQRGSPAALALAARRVVEALLAALRSPLAAPRVLPAHAHLRRALLPAHAAVGDTIARITLRCASPRLASCRLLACLADRYPLRAGSTSRSATSTPAGRRRT